jgi:hypothetical protein
MRGARAVARAVRAVAVGPALHIVQNIFREVVTRFPESLYNSFGELLTHWFYLMQSKTACSNLLDYAFIGTDSFTRSILHARIWNVFFRGVKNLHPGMDRTSEGSDGSL